MVALPVPVLGGHPEPTGKLGECWRRFGTRHVISFRRQRSVPHDCFTSGGACMRPTIGEDVCMTFAPLATDPHHHVLSVSILPPLTPRGMPEQLNNTTITQWWWLIGPFLTIVGTLVGALLLRWVLHRAIDRIVDRAVARAAAHDSQTPHRASRVLSHATGLDEALKTQRAATMGTILKSTSTFVIFTM